MKTGVFIVPAGVGASIGGFAGDASRCAGELSKKYRLIVNPNVVNAACFSGINDNMLYVEGYALDEFFKGNISLNPLPDGEKNKIGVIFDRAIRQEVLNVHINTLNAVETVYGVEISEYEITETEAGIEFFIDKTGISTGNIKNLDTLKKAAEKLIKKGADAIAVVCRFPECGGSDDYSKGLGVDPVGGVEAVISHYLTKEFMVPCAHAPAFDDITIPTEIVDKRCAAEYITPTFLPCVLLGLNRAPRISKTGEISVEDISFLAVPCNAIGCIPVLEAAKRGIKIYAVKENQTILNVTPFNFVPQCDIINMYSEIPDDIL